ncbi:unnamed protein product [Orchesella dallaii]|uniref:CUB domain-containing protein n=1 Tax=Orchesella dallaii TaxID=48710 RepID=A0ABP1R077_9HEXA
MYPGNMAHVFSTNFGIANYYNNEACTWRFEANQCTLSANCPCVDIPRSWECLGDYLKISTDYVLQNQRFCGGNRPGQPIYSDTDFLSIKFRSDSRQTAAGFTCFVRCEGPGMTLPIVTNVTCPTSF